MTTSQELSGRSRSWYSPIRMYFRLDQLGKNVLRDFFVLVGAAETEVEVPAGNAQRINLWHVPNTYVEYQGGIFLELEKPGSP